MAKLIFALFLMVVFTAFPDGMESIRFHKINRRGYVCFSAAGNRPGIFYYRGPARVVNGIILVHIKGHVSCHYGHYSRWGCRGVELNVVITDQYNNLIYPDRKYIHHNAGLWYKLPGRHSSHSKRLLFTNIANPFLLSRHQQLRVWYGEDLKGFTEGDNRGRACVDVYAWYA